MKHESIKQYVNTKHIKLLEVEEARYKKNKYLRFTSPIMVKDIAIKRMINKVVREGRRD